MNAPEHSAQIWEWVKAHATFGIDEKQRVVLTLPVFAPDHVVGLDPLILAHMAQPARVPS